MNLVAHIGDSLVKLGRCTFGQDAGRHLETRERRSLTLPGIFGVFYYRSANERTLETLRNFLPVPIEPLIQEFGAGATPEEVCARTIASLAAAGVRHVYVSNLPVGRARQTLSKIVEIALQAKMPRG